VRGERRISPKGGKALPHAILAPTGDPTLSIAAKQSRSIKLRFVLPAAISPDDIDTLRMRWALDHDGARDAHETAFARVGAHAAS
jgi:hypothetical protein